MPFLPWGLPLKSPQEPCWPSFCWGPLWLKLAGLFTVLMRPRAILITAIGASLGVLLIGQWINLWLL